MGKLRPSGGYRDLLSFQKATIIYDATFWFCEKFVKQPRMCEQMVQATRSGRQNIAEGSLASATSSQTELRLANVARASLEELLLDYEDFLRHRKMPCWQSDSAEAISVRKAGSVMSERTDLSDEQRYDLYAKWLEHDDAVIRANALLCLIHQTNCLLDKQIAALEGKFVKEGGYTEQLAVARLEERGRQKTEQPGKSSDKIPVCPECGKPMVLRTAKKGKSTGKQFWGCTSYPTCKGIVDL